MTRGLPARIAGAALVAASLGVAVPLAAEARITTITVTSTELFADGMSFGDAGPYLRIRGTAHGELDPAERRNRVIVNLDKAPRNAAGRVEYDVDFYIMRPADPAKGSGTLLYEVNNRGRKLIPSFLNEAKASSPSSFNDPATAADAGNGFVFRRGYTLVWSGWDPDAPRANGGLVIRVPVATNRGKPIVRMIRDEFVFGTRIPASSLTAPLSNEAASLDQHGAVLTLREREADPPRTIPTVGWAFADSRAIKLLPEGTKFRPGVIYDFRYRGKDPEIIGIGFAATRDLVSFLRREAKDSAGNANPIGKVRHALGFGISQSGRYLRTHIGQGFNQDESGRKVFDGVLAHISGIGRVFANAEFAQPNRTNTEHEDHLFPENAFPFAHAKLKDPITGWSGALLRGDGFDPLLIETNTSTEYWQKGASLLATDPLGRHDITVPAKVRLFMISGTQHGGRAGLDDSRGSCSNPRNPHNPAPALRALLVDLEQWVSAGTKPPASRVPTIAAGTLVAAADTGFPAIPGVAIAKRGNAIERFGDWTKPSPPPRKSYVGKVSRVDADGNEIAGLRLPDIAVSLGTYTGWHLYKSPYPEGELCDREGSFIAFAKDAAERAAKGDPRPSLAERYADRASFVAKTEAAASELVSARLLLDEDAARYVEAAHAAASLPP